MQDRTEMLDAFYGQANEDTRLSRSRHGQLEYRTTMAYLKRFLKPGAKVLELGAGTGRYSIALAKEDADVSAVELVEQNLAILRQNGRGLQNLAAYQGDATDLSRFAENTFDLTLSFGPMYHLYEPADVHKAIDEAIRVTKPNGVLFFAFLSVYGVMYANYFYGKWAEGQAENFAADGSVRHFREQLFTGYDVVEFEQLFADKAVEPLATVGTDGCLEPIEDRPDFAMTDAEFDAFAAWYLTVAEKRELLGATNHLLLICRKKTDGR